MTVSHGVSEAPLVVVVVVNWNGCERTANCLTALRTVAYPNLSIVVVDNGSTDDSCATIRRNFPEAQLLETGSNRGFAVGANVGIRHAMDKGARYVWLLNNDAIPVSDCLGELVATAVSNPRLGEIGSVVVDPDLSGDLQAWGGGQVHRWLGFCREARAATVVDRLNFLTAASVLVPASAFADVGLFDERYFLYWEVVDFSFRLKSRGWQLGVAPHAIVRHENGASTAADRAVRDRYFTASGIRFLCAHSPAPWLSVPAFVGARVLKRILKCQAARLTAVVKGVWDFVQSPSLHGAAHPG